MFFKKILDDRDNYIFVLVIFNFLKIRILVFRATSFF